jgi:hypothetical protein
VPWDHSALTRDFYFDLAMATGSLPKGGVSTTSGVDEAVQRRLLQLEEELKKKSDPQQTAKIVKLAQLKERVRQLDEAIREDQQLIFDTYRKYDTAHDPKSRGALDREIGNIQMRMGQRGGESAALSKEIVKLEAEMGLASEKK